MKTRLGFVSNSSSSSFIIISSDRNGYTYPDLSGQTIIVGELGQKEFGWQVEVYNDFWDKLNFCVLQAGESGDKEKERYKMIFKVLKKYTNAKKIVFKLSHGSVPNTIDGYIDHQSSACEGTNIEMFESQDSLRDFLFNSGSEINNSNDNM